MLVLVITGRGLGHLGCQIVRIGVCHYLMDVRDKGLALAKQSGADVFIDVRRGKEKVVEEVQEMTK